MRHWPTLLVVLLLNTLNFAAEDKPAPRPADDQVERERDQPVWETEVMPWGVVFNNSEAYNILNLDHFYPPKK